MARIESDTEYINEKTHSDTLVDITQKQQEDIQNNVLSFNDPTLLMANIGTHNYLKTIHKQQEKKDIIKEFYESNDFSLHKENIINIFNSLVNNDYVIGEKKIERLFVDFCKECVFYLKSHKIISKDTDKSCSIETHKDISLNEIQS